MMRRFIWISVLMLAACGGEDNDYAASAACQEQGNAPGTKAYDDCLMEEKMNRISQEQQAREKMQQQRRQQEILLKKY